MSSNVTHDGGANEPDEELRHQAERSRGHRQRAPWDTTSPRCVRKPDVSILLLASHKKTIETIFFWHSKATHTSRPLRARTQGTYGSFSELRKFRARTREIPAGSAQPPPPPPLPVRPHEPTQRLGRHMPNFAKLTGGGAYDSGFQMPASVAEGLECDWRAFAIPRPLLAGRAGSSGVPWAVARRLLSGPLRSRPVDGSARARCTCVLRGLTAREPASRRRAGGAAEPASRRALIGAVLYVVLPALASALAPPTTRP